METPESEAAAPDELRAEETPPRVREREEFPCGNCGAGMTWDPEADALACEYCGNRVTIPREEGTILERPLEEAGEAARGLGLEVRVARCTNCGAQVAYAEASTSEQCVYCGSANVLAQRANRNALRPESLVPLDVAKGEVEASFRRWLKRLWFRPNDLKKTRRFDAVGVYVPFWTFDCAVHSDWSADAGHYYYENRTTVRIVNGKPRLRTQRVRKIRWVPAWGDRDDAYDDLLINASKGLPEKLLGKLGGFDTSRGLVPYRPEYLAGWRAEEYQLDLEGAWARGQERIEVLQRGHCAADVPGDTHRNLRVKNTIRDVRWKHVLLPLWSLQYRYRGKTWTVLINGQTGRVAGEAPLSWPKILLTIGLVALAVLALIVIA